MAAQLSSAHKRTHSSGPAAMGRADIQALRGFAVTVVILYHAKLGWFGGGYVGVDVFFVISGYLIARLISKGITQRNFSLSEFYFRRAKRLLPAAYTTLCVTALVAPLLLTGAELRDLRAQLFGALSFSANWVLLQQGGYFGGAAELKPLLHMWSLAIEEQFYFLLPSAMLLVPRKAWRVTAAFVVVCSFALALHRAGSDASFYLLPTRAWELGIGVLGGLTMPGQRTSVALKFAFWPALVVLAATPFFSGGAAHPGFVELGACMAALVVIKREHPRAADWFLTRALQPIGDMSYSLYLVHWPLFAFWNNAWIGNGRSESPLAIRLGLIALSLALAFVLYSYIEAPIHSTTFRRRVPFIATAVGLSGLLVAMAFTLEGRASEGRDYRAVRRINKGLAWWSQPVNATEYCAFIGGANESALQTVITAGHRNGVGTLGVRRDGGADQRRPQVP